MSIKDYRDDLLGGNRDEDDLPQIPIVCHVRSGIMRLVRPKTDQDEKNYTEDLKIYNAEVEKGTAWDEIKKKIKGKLTPQNADYFTVREIDTKTFPENAEILHKLYADPDGEIRRLPIVFFFDDYFLNMPHSLTCWTASELRYWSKYRKVREESGEIGYERLCMRSIGRGKVKRAFGGKETEAWRVCEPDDCHEYQEGECKLSGYVQGVVPGVRGGGLLAIHTKSIYSYMQMMRKMKMILAGTKHLRGLYKPGTNDPLFFVRKVSDEEISRFDADKQKSVRTSQDLIYLETDVELNEILLEQRPERVLARGEEAKAILSPKKELAPAKEDSKVKIYDLDSKKAESQEKEEKKPDPIAAKASELSDKIDDAMKETKADPGIKDKPTDDNLTLCGRFALRISEAKTFEDIKAIFEEIDGSPGTPLSREEVLALKGAGKTRVEELLKKLKNSGGSDILQGFKDRLSKATFEKLGPILAEARERSDLTDEQKAKVKEIMFNRAAELKKN
jgi:hypothetical protein